MPWLKALYHDFNWLRTASRLVSELPDPEDDLHSWETLAVEHRAQWKAILNKARASSIFADTAATAAAEDDKRIEAELDTAEGRSPQKKAGDQACPECGQQWAWCGRRAAGGAHAWPLAWNPPIPGGLPAEPAFTLWAGCNNSCGLPAEPML